MARNSPYRRHQIPPDIPRDSLQISFSLRTRCACSSALSRASTDCVAALPVSAEIDARLVPHRQSHHPVNLDSVGVAPMILAPCALLREASEVRAGEMV